MVQYRLKEAAFIGGVLKEAGEIVDYDGTPADHMEAAERSAAFAAPDAVLDGANVRIVPALKGGAKSRDNKRKR